MAKALLFAAMLIAAFGAAAAPARPIAEDPALEERVTRVTSELRCLVCQNQTLADSHAPLAVDLKNQVREMMAAGRSDDDVVRFMVERYGDFVLYRPPFRASTLALWLGPLAIAIGSIVFLVRRIRALPREERTAPDADAARRADALLGLDRSEGSR